MIMIRSDNIGERILVVPLVGLIAGIKRATGVMEVRNTFL